MYSVMENLSSLWEALDAILSTAKKRLWSLANVNVHIGFSGMSLLCKVYPYFLRTY